jgi:hypothetical protein
MCRARVTCTLAMEKVDARSQQVVVADKDSVRPQQHVVYFIIVVAAAHVTCTLAMEKVDARSQQVVVADKDSVRPQQHVVYFIIVVAAGTNCTNVCKLRYTACRDYSADCRIFF